MPPSSPPLQVEAHGPPTFFGQTIPLGDGSLVYVLDYSSSMGVVSERVDYQTTLSRWDVVSREARRSLSALSPAVRFDLVVFGTQGGCGVSVWRPKPVPATSANTAAAIAWLGTFNEALVHGGATPTAPAVIQALAMDPEVVLLLTDGVPSPCGLKGYPHIVHRRRIREANQGGARIDVFGVGLPDSYAEEFATGVAADSSGTFVELD